MPNLIMNLQNYSMEDEMSIKFEHSFYIYFHTNNQMALFIETILRSSPAKNPPTEGLTLSARPKFR